MWDMNADLKYHKKGLITREDMENFTLYLQFVLQVEKQRSGEISVFYFISVLYFYQVFSLTQDKSCYFAYRY